MIIPESVFWYYNLKFPRMIDIHSKYDNMDKSGMFYAVIYINNDIFLCIICMYNLHFITQPLEETKMVWRLGELVKGTSTCQILYHALIVLHQSIKNTILIKNLYNQPLLDPLDVVGWWAHSSYLTNTKEPKSDLMVFIYQSSFFWRMPRMSWGLLSSIGVHTSLLENLCW